MRAKTWPITTIRLSHYLSLTFESNSASNSAEEHPCGNEDLMEDNTDDSVDLIEAERIACFAHLLQLAVGDGMKETKSVSTALSKAVSASKILHRSTAYKVWQ